MRILIHGVNFAPEPVGVGKYTAEMATWLATRGADVRVLTTWPHYPGPAGCVWKTHSQRLGPVHVRRLPLVGRAGFGGRGRMLRMAGFGFASLVWLGLRSLTWRAWRPDAVLAVMPTTAGLPAALLAARLSGARTVLHVQDLEAELGARFGMLPPLAAGWALRGESWLARRFDRVSTVSEGMAKRLAGKGIDPARIVMAPNWAGLPAAANPQRSRTYRRQLGCGPQDVLALFSGSMGRKQALEGFAACARLLRDEPGLVIAVCGEGAGRERFAAMVSDLPRVRLLPLQPADEFPALLDAADIHLLPRCPGIDGLALPSRLGPVLVRGGVVAAQSEPDSEVARLVRRAGGEVTQPGDVKAFVRAVAVLARDPGRRAAAAEQARRVGEDLGDPDRALEPLWQALRELVDVGSGS